MGISQMFQVLELEVGGCAKGGKGGGERSE